MAEPATDLEAKILELFNKKKKMMTSRDVGNALGLDHATAKRALSELVKAGKLEFTSFGGATFIKLPGEEGNPN